MATLKLHWDVKSSRVKRLKEQMFLFDSFLAKMMEIDKKGLELAIANRNGNFIVGLAGKAGTALKIREKTNNNDGVYVEAIQKVGAGRKGEPWCMYYQQVLVGIAEVLLGIASLFPYSGSCASVRGSAAKIKGIIIDKKNSIFGTIWIKKYPKTGLGHTEAFDNWKTFNKVAILNGGNTTEGKLGGEVIREGGGTYETTRSNDGTWVMAINAFPAQVTAPEVKPSKPVSDKGEIPKFNERSDNVASMQRAMNEKFNAGVDVDGWFYNQTKKALAKIQKANGLPGGGLPGKKTMALLGFE